MGLARAAARRDHVRQVGEQGIEGGGARGAYQVGVLKAVCKVLPRGYHPFPVVQMDAVEALAQAFSTFTTGIDPIRAERNTTWPRMHS